MYYVFFEKARQGNALRKQGKTLTAKKLLQFVFAFDCTFATC